LSCSKSGVAGGSVSNDATVNCTGNGGLDSTGDVTSNTATCTIPDCPPCQVQITKTVAPDIACDTIADTGFSDFVTVVQDECVVYEICVTNTGDQDLNANGVEVSDTHLGIVSLNFGTILIGAPEVCKLIPSSAGADNCDGPSTDTFGSCECLDVEGVNTAEITSAICTLTGDNACDQDGSICSDTAEVECIPECGDGEVGNTGFCRDVNTHIPVPGSFCLEQADCVPFGSGLECRTETCELGQPGCRDDCTSCGDVIVDKNHGETCDTNAEPPVSGGAPRTCRPAGDPAECTYCGDDAMVVGDPPTAKGLDTTAVPPEACDDGNDNNTDACNNQCQPTTCAVDIIKDSSCDGGLTWGDGCSTLAGNDVQVRYTYSNAGDASLFNCVITDSNQVITADPGVSVTPDGDMIAANAECTALFAGGEPDTATITCDCGDPINPFDTVSDTDPSNFSCETCGVDIIKESSCDGGQTWGDGCVALDSADVMVRYRYRNTEPAVGGADLVSCTVDESNSLIPDITTGFGLAAGDPEVTDPRITDDCLTLFTGGEPDTATIRCECADPAGVNNQPVEAEDPFNFECISCDVDLVKVEKSRFVTR
jgi:hypothetical protein